ncbi:MAG: glycosyltransferase [Bryobacterales bacterium]|nr:glycosyltransferase [Bryobacterales bacterium]
MRIRVLEVLATLKRAGAERMVVSLVAGLDPERFESRVLSLYDAFPGGFEPVLAGHDIPVAHLAKHGGFDPRMYPRLYRVFREFRPHILHTHSYVMRYTFPSGLAARVPLMLHTVHNVALNETDRVGRALHRVAYRCGVVPVAVGQEVARSFEEYYGFAPRATIANGIDLSAYCEDSGGASWKRAHGFAETDRLAVSVARLDPQKDPVALIEAFTAALRGYPEWHLILAGTGGLRDELEQLTQRFGMAHRIHFLGVVSDVPAMLQAASLFILASRWEGTPLAVMEAMAAGVPVVATRVGGVPGLVDDGVSGVLVEPGDSQRLAEAVASVALNEARRVAFGEAACRKAASFSVEAMVSSYARLFEECMRGRL